MNVVVVLAGLATAPALAQGGPGFVERATIDPGLDSRPPQVVRSTPASSWRGFLDQAGRGEFAVAAHYLDLSEVPISQQRDVGTRMARELFEVTRKLHLGPNSVRSDDPEGPVGEVTPSGLLSLMRFQHAGIAGELFLQRTKDMRSGELAWLFSRQTVSNVRLWHSVLVDGETLESTDRFNEGLGTPPPDVRRGNPRESVQGFLAATERGRFDLAAHYLDLSAVPTDRQRAEGARLARRLMLVLLRAGIDPDVLSNDPLGVPEADVADDEERVATFRGVTGSFDVVLSRHIGSQAEQVWTFSPATVAQIDRFYRAAGFGWLADHLPGFFFTLVIGGLQLWQWTALLLIVAAGWLAGRLAGRLLVRLLQAMVRRTEAKWDDDVVAALDGPAGMIIWAFAVAAATPLVGLTEAGRRVATIGWRLMALLGLGWLLMRLVDALVAHLKTLGDRNAVAASFAPILRKIGSIMVVALMVLGALDVIGFNVVAFLAGLGLGGVAVAFAAQKTIENLFGAVSIAADRPFGVGDYVRIGDVTGTVEEIGLRSTRIRTLERTLVTIPNGVVAAGTIVNYGERDRILFNPTLGVAYGTSAAQITLITDEIRKLLLSHPRVWPDTTRCRFKGFGASSLDIEVLAWIDTRDYIEYTLVAEELNFAIARIVETAGSSFAFPSRTVYLARDAGIDAAKTAAAEAEVARRRAAGELAVPEPSADMLERLRRQRNPSQG